MISSSLLPVSGGIHVLRTWRFAPEWAVRSLQSHRRYRCPGMSPPAERCLRVPWRRHPKAPGLSRRSISRSRTDRAARATRSWLGGCGRTQSRGGRAWAAASGCGEPSSRLRRSHAGNRPPPPSWTACSRGRSVRTRHRSASGGVRRSWGRWLSPLAGRPRLADHSETTFDKSLGRRLARRALTMEYDIPLVPEHAQPLCFREVDGPEASRGRLAAPALNWMFSVREEPKRRRTR